LSNKKEAAHRDGPIRFPLEVFQMNLIVTRT